MFKMKFIGGFNLKSVLITSKNILKNSKVPVLNYAIENRNKFENTYNTYCKLIDNLDSNSKIAIKFSSFNFNQILINKIIQKCINKNIKILIDAESNEFNNKYNEISNKLIEKYNNDDVNLYKTYQMYRIDSLNILKYDYKYFSSKKINYGIKLVRGAYWNSEKNDGHLFTNKDETDLSYNNAIFYLSDKQNVDVILATHNHESINLGVLFNNNNISKFKFAHLLDMNEKYYKKLNDNNIHVYIPFGPFNEMIPYLIRRLYENLSTLKYMI